MWICPLPSCRWVTPRHLRRSDAKLRVGSGACKEVCRKPRVACPLNQSRFNPQDGLSLWAQSTWFPNAKLSFRIAPLLSQVDCFRVCRHPPAIGGQLSTSMERPFARRLEIRGRLLLPRFRLRRAEYSWARRQNILWIKFVLCLPQLGPLLRSEVILPIGGSMRRRTHHILFSSHCPCPLE